MEKAMDKKELLVGVTGKDVLRDAFDSILSQGGPTAQQDVYKFIDSFGEQRDLHEYDVKPVIDLLEAGGVPRNRAAREIMSNMVSIMSQKISTLKQDQLSLLLERSYSYLTVPELAPVAIKTLGCMKHVRPDIWTEIVNNGLDESPYIDLPISIKRRIWKQERSAFEYEIESLVDKVPELQAPTLETLSAMQPYEFRKGNKHLKDLNQLVYSMGENNNIIVAEKLIEKANAEQSLPKKMAIANLFHDFIHNVQIREGNALAHARQVAREVDKTQTLVYDKNLLQGVRDSLPMLTDYPLLVLLNTSTYSRDFVAECLVARLRKMAERFRQVDEQHRSTAARDLARDTDLGNLTFICLFTMKLKALVSGADIVQETETEQAVASFYPLMIAEIANDQKWTQDEYHRENARLPDPALSDCIVNGRLERRVLSTYCRYLLQHNNTVGLRRLHRVLDKMIPHCDEVDEIREIAIARGICEILSIKKVKQ